MVFKRIDSPPAWAPPAPKAPSPFAPRPFAPAARQTFVQNKLAEREPPPDTEELEITPVTDRVAQGRRVDVNAGDFKGLIAEQAREQKEVKETPADFAGEVVTVGFEHEFAEMTSGPLLGVSHLKLAKSSESMPFTNIPFTLETDASNAVELVSPPFLLGTAAKDVPIPEPDDVEKVDTIIKARLGELTTEQKNLGGLAKAFGGDPGLKFALGNVSVEPENLTHNTRQPFMEEKNEVKSGDVLGIGLKPITKFGTSGAISSQVNFVTDAKSHSVMQDLYKPEGKEEANVHVRIFSDLEAAFYTELSTAATAYAAAPGATWVRNEGFNIFLKAMARTLSGLLAVPSIQKVKEFQAAEFTGAYEGKSSRNRIKAKSGADYTKFNFDAAMSSHVKDVKGVWLKDTLMNLGIGLLAPEDWLAVLTIAGSAGLLAFVKGLKPVAYRDLTADAKSRYGENLTSASGEMALALQEIAKESGKLYLNGSNNKFIGPEEQPGFMTHDVKWGGPRQDTYLPAEKVQMPGIWDEKRLHVAETRAAGIATLKELKKRLVPGDG